MVKKQTETQIWVTKSGFQGLEKGQKGQKKSNLHRFHVPYSRHHDSKSFHPGSYQITPTNGQKPEHASPDESNGLDRYNWSF